MPTPKSLSGLYLYTMSGEALVVILLICIAFVVWLKMRDDRTLFIPSKELLSDLEVSIDPQEFANDYVPKHNKLVGGEFCFFGLWQGRPFDNFREIRKIEYDLETHVLTIELKNGVLKRDKVVLTKPSQVHIYTTFPNSEDSTKTVVIFEAEALTFYRFYEIEGRIRESRAHFVVTDGKVVLRTEVSGQQPKYTRMTYNQEVPAMFWA